MLHTTHTYHRNARPIDAIYSIIHEMADPRLIRFDEAHQRIRA